MVAHHLNIVINYNFCPCASRNFKFGLKVVSKAICVLKVVSKNYNFWSKCLKRAIWVSKAQVRSTMIK